MSNLDAERVAVDLQNSYALLRVHLRRLRAKADTDTLSPQEKLLAAEFSSKIGHLHSLIGRYIPDKVRR